MKSRPLVLVVEDDFAVRRFIARTLEENGFQVMEVADATECLNIVLRQEPAIDLVITDIVMPRMSGLDLAAELGRRHRDLKILYVSGYGGSVAIQGITHKAPHLVLLKPFTEEALLQRVRRLCS